ncbi:ISL3 family transposase [Actinomadura chokoriensis]|uniref:ISL3 family transposase n=1 Tax=Actinomadura chokoriensis TaxID=454156 RepID=A0ABV4R8X7_9ACTN
MSIKELVTVLFPYLARVCVDRVTRCGTSVQIKAGTTTREAGCPGCGTVSRRRHSHYERRLTDTAVGRQEVLIHLRVHRFRCGNDACARQTFAEQVPGLTVRYGRRTTGAGEALRAIALALGGRAGARLAERLLGAVSRTTLIRLIRGLFEAAAQTPRVLGVDDFALRRGRVYGSILIDITTGRPVEVLADRTADTLAAWLRAHPGVEIVCRDRAGAYAEGIARGAPEAIQVADRWHIWRNLGDAVERAVARQRRHLHVLAEKAQVPEAPPARRTSQGPEGRKDRVAVRTRQRHAAVHALLAQDLTIPQIADELQLSRNTVRRFARTADPGQLLVHNGTGKRTKDLQAYDSYLRTRWNQGCTNARRLHDELAALGYRGAITTVRQYLQPWRTGLPAPAARRPPTVRQATAWFLSSPARVDPADERRLDTLCDAGPQLAVLRDRVREFAEMMVHRRGQRLETWMTVVAGDDLPELHSFVLGLRRDQDAVTAGLTLPYSSGPVEGHVNRIIMWNPICQAMCLWITPR